MDAAAPARAGPTAERGRVHGTRRVGWRAVRTGGARPAVETLRGPAVWLGVAVFFVYTGTEATAGFGFGFVAESAAILGAALLPSLVGVLVGRFGLEAVGASMLAAALGLIALHEVLQRSVGPAAVHRAERVSKAGSPSESASTAIERQRPAASPRLLVEWRARRMP